MAKSRLQKKVVVDEIAKLSGDAKSVVFVSFKGLPVKEETALRSSLRAEGVKYKVVKKTLLSRALEGKFPGEKPEIEGMGAIAVGDDMIAPARGVYEFQKTHAGMISIVGGVFEGKYVSATEMMEIATIPGHDVLFAKFLNVINSPIQRFASVVDQYAKKMEA